MNANLDTVQYGRNTQFFLWGTHLYFIPTLLVRPHDDPLFLNITTYLHQQQHFIHHGIGCPVYSLLKNMCESWLPFRKSQAYYSTLCIFLGVWLQWSLLFPRNKTYIMGKYLCFSALSIPNKTNSFKFLAIAFSSVSKVKAFYIPIKNLQVFPRVVESHSWRTLNLRKFLSPPGLNNTCKYLWTCWCC